MKIKVIQTIICYCHCQKYRRPQFLAKCVRIPKKADEGLCNPVQNTDYRSNFFDPELFITVKHFLMRFRIPEQNIQNPVRNEQNFGKILRNPESPETEPEFRTSVVRNHLVPSRRIQMPLEGCQSNCKYNFRLKGIPF